MVSVDLRKSRMKSPKMVVEEVLLCSELHDMQIDACVILSGGPMTWDRPRE